MARDYAEILQGVLNRIPDQYDKREGSVLWEAVSPLCAEIAQIELAVEAMGAEAFLATAGGAYLDLLASQYGFVRELGTPATVKAEIVGGNVAIGNKFASVDLLDSIIYQVCKLVGDGVYELQATKVNPQANYYTGPIVMLDYINGLKSAKITEVIIPQQETETDAQFRQRVQENLVAESTDGNIQQYYKWLSELDGVGKAKVYPLWNGVNTVKCLVLNELNTPASQELITKVQNSLDPNQEGLGNGKAPIGSVVTISTATAKPINITAQVVYLQGKTMAPTLRAELEKFLADIALERSVVSYLQTASVITNNQDIDYIVSLTINGEAMDVPVLDGEVGVLEVLNVN